MSKEELNKIYKWGVLFLLLTTVVYILHAIPSNSIFVTDWQISAKVTFSIIDGIAFLVCLSSYVDESEIYKS